MSDATDNRFYREPQEHPSSNDQVASWLEEMHDYAREADRPYLLQAAKIVRSVAGKHVCRFVNGYCFCGKTDAELGSKRAPVEPPAAPLDRIADAAADEAAVNQLFDLWWNAQDTQPNYFQTYCSGYGAGVVRGAYGMARPSEPPPAAPLSTNEVASNPLNSAEARDHAHMLYASMALVNNPTAMETMRRAAQYLEQTAEPPTAIQPNTYAVVDYPGHSLHGETVRVTELYQERRWSIRAHESADGKSFTTCALAETELRPTSTKGCDAT